MLKFFSVTLSERFGIHGSLLKQGGKRGYRMDTREHYLESARSRGGNNKLQHRGAPSGQWSFSPKE